MSAKLVHNPMELLFNDMPVACPSPLNGNSVEEEFQMFMKYTAEWVAGGGRAGKRLTGAGGRVWVVRIITIMRSG